MRLTLYGDGSQTRAFCYVDDLIEGILRMRDAPDDITGPMNLGNPVEPRSPNWPSWWWT
jgi:UDP-glucuronate decarboxylase